MKKSIILASLLIVGMACHHPKPIPLGFDFSAIQPFWNIMDTLAADQEPSADLWNSVLGTPGYQTLIEHEFKYEWMQIYMRGGVMPSSQELYQKWAAAGYWDTIFPYHIREVYSRKSEIMAFAEVINDPAFVARAVDLAREYWIDEEVPAGIPPLAFLFFSKDARGYDPVVIDLLFALERYQKGGLTELLAHEIHHYYRNKVLSFTNPPDNSPDFHVVHALNQVHLEGMADQIDKSKSLANPFYASLNENYQKLLKGTPNDIRRLDSLLVVYGSAPDSIKTNLADQIARSTPNSGHPMGYYMSTLMLRTGSMDDVLKDVGNPFQFFIRYKMAAANSQIQVPMLSDRAIEVINELERKYRKTDSAS